MKKKILIKILREALGEKYVYFTSTIKKRNKRETTN